MSAVFDFLRRNAWGRAALMLALFLLAATLFRLALYLHYHEDFQALDAGEVLAAFRIGLNFDLSMAMLLIGLPLLLLLLPFGWSLHRYWQGLWSGVVLLMLLVFGFMMAVDFFYFGYVHRHVGSEINTLANDMDSIVEIVLRQYTLALLGFCASVLFAAWLWQRLFRLPVTPPRSFWGRLLLLPLLLLLMAVIGRGGISGKPISVGEAFFSNIPAQGYLALNGAFALSRALVESPPPPKVFMPAAEAAGMVQDYLTGDRSAFPQPDYPLYRQMRPVPVNPKPNIVVLMLESWGAQHIDALRRLAGQPALGTTPNFDALAKEGRLYTRFYANGQRSIQGGAAILASQPTFPAMPFLGEGLEQNRLSFMGELARLEGYDTYFLQSSDRSSLRFDAIAARAGFTTYRGAQDLRNFHERPKPPRTWGTWDHNTLQEANLLFAAAKRPFLGFVFTSSTHTPWVLPDERFRRFKGGTREEFLSSLYYADWALGEFIAAAKAAGYYQDTIFVLTADHADEFVEGAQDVPNLYHIPLLIVGPGIKPGVDTRIGSQFDILPTLMELAGWQGPYAGMGRSLLEEDRQEQRASLGIRGNVLDWIGTAGWVTHDLERPLGHAASMKPEQVAWMQRQLLASYQVLSAAQTGNRILPPETKR